MAPITPPLDLVSVLPLALESYLSGPTGITDWQDPSSTVSPPDDGTYAASGNIWITRYTPVQGNRGTDNAQRNEVNIRLLLAANDYSDVQVRAASWAQLLCSLVWSTTSLFLLNKTGSDLSGTFKGVVVPANTTLKIMDGLASTISVEGLYDGGVATVGGRAKIDLRFDVTI